MISVLIPIYNCNVLKLVDTILEQGRRSGVFIEIICMDDGSKKSIKVANEALRHKFAVNYIELTENVGRAKIRNWLAKLARYDHLLFLDCDSQIDEDLFLENYLKLVSGNKVISGGTKYTDKPPRSLKKRLHWKYGKNVESQSADVRNSKPYLSFTSNNFIIQKEIFNKNKFDETISGYGYEDTVFAFDLKKSSISIHHSDNPVLHTGIEYTDTFLEKTSIAIANLYGLSKSEKIQHTKLLETVRFLTKCKVDKLVYKLLHRYQENLIKNLHHKDPNLKYFSLYKLYLFLTHKYSTDSDNTEISNS